MRAAGLYGIIFDRSAGGRRDRNLCTAEAGAGRYDMDEKMKILKMLETGEINAEKAAELMEKSQTQPAVQQTVRNPSTGKTGKTEGKRILVIDSSGKAGDKVTIKLPVGVVTRLLESADRLPLPAGLLPEGFTENTDISELTEAVRACLDSDMEDDIAEIVSEHGTRTRIYTE